jgi:hypothetical protein
MPRGSAVCADELSARALPLGSESPTDAGTDDRRSSNPVVCAASICAFALVEKERSRFAFMLVGSIRQVARSARHERLGDEVVAGGPLLIRQAASRRSRPVRSGSAECRARLRRRRWTARSRREGAARGARRQRSARAGSRGGSAFTSASIWRAKARAAGAGWPGEGCPSCDLRTRLPTTYSSGPKSPHRPAKSFSRLRAEPRRFRNRWIAANAGVGRI